MESPHSTGRRVLRVVKLVVFTLLMIQIARLIQVVVDDPIVVLSPFADSRVDGALSHQLNALLVAGLALLVTFLFAGKIRLRYLHPRRTGELRPFFAQPAGGRWERDGWYFAAIMTAIIAVVTYFQFAPGGFEFHWSGILMVIPLAAMNAFTEEVIFRLPYVTMGANDTKSRTYGLVFGSLVFGIMHYGGVAPNGLTGAILSALTGFILAKSIQETRGFFWAFTIHFALDLPIFLYLLNQAP